MIKVFLSNGRLVLGKESSPGHVSAKTFANRTQAQKAAAKVNGEVIRTPFSRIFYVEVEGQS